MLSAKKTGWLAICAALIAVLLVSSFPFVGVPLGSKSSGNLISIAYAQDGCEGCSNSYPEHIKAKADWENCADEDKVRYYQRYLAASNKFTQCLNRGCDTGTGGPTATPDNGGGDLPPVCGDGICEIDKGESCANCLSDCPCGQGEICNPSDSNADARGCTMPSMALTVSTGKKTYFPGEMVVVDGSVQDAEGNGILDVFIDIKVEGTDLSTFTYSGIVYDLRGGYSTVLPIPPDFPPGTYTVKVTASKSEYPSVSTTTSFTVGPLKELTFTINLDPEKSSEDLRIKKFNHFNTFYPTENILVTGVVRDVESNKHLNRINFFIDSMNQEKKAVSETGGIYGKGISNEGLYIYTTKIQIPENTPLGTYTVKVTASGVAHNNVGYAEKTITENFEVEKLLTINEFVDYLRELEAKNPKKTRGQLIAYLHADAYPGDVNGKKLDIRLFQDGPETDGYENVNIVRRAPKWIVDLEDRRIDISHSYARLRSDSNREGFEKWFMGNANMHWGDYYQSALDYEPEYLAMLDAILLPEFIKRPLFGGRGRAPTDQLIGDDIGTLLAEYYSKDSNQNKPLSEAYKYCLEEYSTLGDVKKTRINHYNQGAFIGHDDPYSQIPKM